MSVFNDKKVCTHIKALILVKHLGYCLVQRMWYISVC